MDKVRIYKDPYGVALVMGAWNYPMQLTLLPVGAAIAAGNCVIVKPSEVAPATAKFIADTLPKYIDNVREEKPKLSAHTKILISIRCRNVTKWC